jgi:hypothetical protein
MRTKKSFKVSPLERLEARDVPSAVAPYFILKGHNPPPSHNYPVGVNTPYFILNGHPAPLTNTPAGVNTPY